MMSNLFELNDQFRELSQRDDLDPTVTNKKVPINAIIIEMQSIRRGHCR